MEGFVDFGRDEREHLQKAISTELTRSHQGRLFVSNHTEDGDVFCQNLAIVELKDRYVAFGVDLSELSTIREPFSLIDLNEIEFHVGLVERNVVGKAAGIG